MKIFLLKDVVNVGMAGEIVKVAEGYGANFIIPKKLGIQITPQNEDAYLKKAREVVHRKEVIATETSMLAEKIKSTKLSIKKKMHDDDRLYAAVSAHDVVELLDAKGIKVSKSMVVFDKSIKAKGTYEVTIKLSSRLQPKLALVVLPE